MKDFERIEGLSKDVEFIQNIVMQFMKRQEKLLGEYIEMLKVYEDIILTFIKRDMEENGVAEDD